VKPGKDSESLSLNQGKAKVFWKIRCAPDENNLLSQGELLPNALGRNAREVTDGAGDKAPSVKPIIHWLTVELSVPTQ
jgi:hypothetical protein